MSVQAQRSRRKTAHDLTGPSAFAQHKDTVRCEVTCGLVSRRPWCGVGGDVLDVHDYRGGLRTFRVDMCATPQVGNVTGVGR